MDDPVRDAEVFYLQRDNHQQQYEELFEQRYEENLYDFSVFQSFLHDLDSDDPEWKLLFDQIKGDKIDKEFAYDNMIILYEYYVKELTEMILE